MADRTPTLQRRADSARPNANAVLTERLFFAGLYFAMLARYFTRGFQYFTYTDDNNQYGVYFRRALQGDIWNDIILYYRRFFERPLAFLSDAYIFQNFFEQMHILLIIITTMYFLICVLLYKTFRQFSVGLGRVFLIFLALVPCAYEGAYWISASSRIVVSMFFGVLSIWLYFGGVKKIDRRIIVALSVVTNLMSLLYYEQTALFSFALFFVCAVMNAVGDKKKAFIKSTAVSMIIPVVNMTLTAAYYLYFMFFSSEGVSESRNKFITGSFIEKITSTTGEIADLIKETLINFNITAIGNGFKEPITVWIVFVLLILVVFTAITALFENTTDMQAKKWFLLKLITGVVLSFAPLSIFYLLQNVYFEPRMLFPSFVGFAILLDLLFDLVAVICRPATTVKRVCAAVMIIPFFLASVSITGVYQETYALDKAIARNFLAAYEQSHTAQTEKVYLLNTAASYTGHKTPPLANITAADWIMLGNLNANQRQYYFRNLTLVRATGNFDASVLNDPSALVLGIDGSQHIFPLTVGAENTLFDEQGNVFGAVRDGIFVRRGDY